MTACCIVHGTPLIYSVRNLAHYAPCCNTWVADNSGTREVCRGCRKPYWVAKHQGGGRQKYCAPRCRQRAYRERLAMSSTVCHS